MGGALTAEPMIILRGRRRPFHVWLVEWLNRARRRPAGPRLTPAGWILPTS